MVRPVQQRVDYQRDWGIGGACTEESWSIPGLLRAALRSAPDASCFRSFAALSTSTRLHCLQLDCAYGMPAGEPQLTSLLG